VIVGQRLGFDALSRVDHQQRSLAGRKRARDFRREVDVAGRVDEVERVDLAVFGRIAQGDRMHLDRDAAFALEVHRVEMLFVHLTQSDRFGHLEQAV
jgi:hypothetical protein